MYIKCVKLELHLLKLIHTDFCAHRKIYFARFFFAKEMKPDAFSQFSW